MNEFRGLGKISDICGSERHHRGSELVPHGSSRATLFASSQFFGKTYRLATIHT